MPSRGLGGTQGLVHLGVGLSAPARTSGQWRARRPRTAHRHAVPAAPRATEGIGRPVTNVADLSGRHPRDVAHGPPPSLVGGYAARTLDKAGRAAQRRALAGHVHAPRRLLAPRPLTIRHPLERRRCGTPAPRSGQVTDSPMPSTRAPRAGYHSVTPRIVVADVDAQVEFLRTVFDATGAAVTGRPAEMLIGDSLVMVTAAVEGSCFPAFLYVDDADVVFRRSLAAGAVAVEEPLDTAYGDRRAMIRDPFGNIFQIAHQISASR